MIGGESIGEQNNPESEAGTTMKLTNRIPAHPTLSFASKCTKPELRRTLQGAGPLARLPPVLLDRTFAVPVHPPL